MEPAGTRRVRRMRIPGMLRRAAPAAFLGAALIGLCLGAVWHLAGSEDAGRPAIVDVIALEGFEPMDVLTRAASLDQLSAHLLAGALGRGAHEPGLTLETPVEFAEVAGSGVRGVVGGHRVALGRAAWIAPLESPAWTRPIRRRAGRCHPAQRPDPAGCGPYDPATAARPDRAGRDGDR